MTTSPIGYDFEARLGPMAGWGMPRRTVRQRRARCVLAMLVIRTVRMAATGISAMSLKSPQARLLGSMGLGGVTVRLRGRLIESRPDGEGLAGKGVRTFADCHLIPILGLHDACTEGQKRILK